MRRDEGGMAAITTVLLLPFLLSVLAGVAQIGALRVIAGRVSTAADLATLAATDDQDPVALAASGALRLAPDAEAVARRYFALNLAQLGPQLAVPPDVAATEANVAAQETSVIIRYLSTSEPRLFIVSYLSASVPNSNANGPRIPSARADPRIRGAHRAAHSQFS